MYVMSVSHKTMIEGYAKVILEGVDCARVVQYLALAKPLQDAEMAFKSVFVLSGP